MARLLEKYRNEVVPRLMQQFGLKNRLAAPRIEKIVVNMGVGAATENPKRLEDAAAAMAVITGQKAAITRAKKSVAGFKVRQGQAIGCKVTLRGARMYEFLDRLISVAIPRIRDFRGLSPDSFDGHGNYNMGLTEQLVFPEVDPDASEFTQGMDITFVIAGNSDERSRALLVLLGLPLRREETAEIRLSAK